MRGARFTVLICLSSTIMVALAMIRIEQVRCLARIQHAHLQQETLRHQLADRISQIARLRAPDRIKDRIQRLDLRVYAPEEAERIRGTDDYAFAAH